MTIHDYCLDVARRREVRDNKSSTGKTVYPLKCPYCGHDTFSDINGEWSKFKILLKIKIGFSNALQIKKELYLAYGTIVGHLLDLESKGYIKRIDGTSNLGKKEVTLSLTQKGEEFLNG
jgi:hypothetical protein